MRYTCVLLDIDGTLLDSNDAHAEAFAQAFAEAGYEVPFERVRLLIGMGSDRLIPAATGVLDAESDVGKQIADRKKAIFAERYLPDLKPFPGARALVERLRDAGCQLVVATSAGEDEVAGLLERAGVADLLPLRTSADDADESKPDPDILKAAMAKGGCDAASTVMIGDTPYDVEAANRAGVAMIAVRSGGWPFDDPKGTVAVYDDVADLLSWWDQSVFA